jgi:MFS family permease
MPFLTLVLPVQVQAVAPNDKIALLSLITLIGAVVASVMNIVAGALSDRTVQSVRGRRPWIAFGLVMTLASYIALALCSTGPELIAGVIVFQIALNLMLGPLGSIAADEVAHSQKGIVSGAMGAAYALGSFAGLAVTASPTFTRTAQLGIIAALVTACVVPFLVFCTRRGRMIQNPSPEADALPRSGREFTRVWIARLLVQICGSVLFAYLLFYFQTVNRDGLTIGPTDVAAQVAWLASSVTIILVPLSIMVGRASDLARSRKPFMTVTAAMLTVGLIAMTVTHHWVLAFTGYILFTCGLSLFLAIQNAYTMELLNVPVRRGRAMGVLNLTNTLPAMIAPMLAYLLARDGDFTRLLLALLVFSLGALVLVLFVQEPTSPRSVSQVAR